MADDLDEKPVEDEKEDLISEAMVRKATYLIHKLADRRGADFKEIQKKCKKLLRYENLAKVSLDDGHRIIDKLIELTGGEEEEDTQITQGRITELPKKPDMKQKFQGEALPAITELEKEIGVLSKMFQICVSDSKEIFNQEFGKESISEATRATLIKSFAATIFIEAGKRGIGR